MILKIGGRPANISSARFVVSYRNADGPQLLGHGHRTLGKIRWDVPTQSTMFAAGQEIPWHEVAQDRQEWNSLEAEIVRRVTQAQRDMHLPAGRWMMAEAEAMILHLVRNSFSASTSAHT